MKVKIENIAEKETKNGIKQKNIQVKGKWYSGFLNEFNQNWKIGDEVFIDTYEKLYNGKVFNNYSPANPYKKVKRTKPKAKQVVEEVFEDNIVENPFDDKEEKVDSSKKEPTAKPKQAIKKDLELKEMIDIIKALAEEDISDPDSGCKIRKEITGYYLYILQLVGHLKLEYKRVYTLRKKSEKDKDTEEEHKLRLQEIELENKFDLANFYARWIDQTLTTISFFLRKFENEKKNNNKQ